MYQLPPLLCVFKFPIRQTPPPPNRRQRVSSLHVSPALALYFPLYIQPLSSLQISSLLSLSLSTHIYTYTHFCVCRYAFQNKMAVLGSRLLHLFCMLFALSAAVASAAHSAPAPAVDCSSLVLNMADCLSFVTAGSTAAKPEGTCCSGLKTVLKTGATCLCEAFRNSAQLGVTLNVTKALSLPTACHVSAPSVSNCGCNFLSLHLSLYFY